MRRVKLVVVTGFAAIASLLIVQSASAATSAGNTCASNTGAPSFTLVNLAGSGNPLPNAIPSAGVITSWTFTNSLSLSGVTVQTKLKILRPTGTAKQFQVVGESTLGTVGLGTSTFSTRIPVQSGDLIGATGTVTNSTETVQLVLFCGTSSSSDLIGAIPGDPAVGSTAAVTIEQSELAVPVTVKVEPDADGDGYGDETQDQCPTNAATQGPCPAPPAPITLSATGAAKKGSVVVTLTASAQASVTVAGTVKVGGSNVKLSGGTQTVAPGTLAKFTVLFPAKLKKQLKKTPTSKKLTLEMSASAPGATTSAFKVKAKGQMKPKSKKS